jgi:hypothetical protein
MNTQFKLCAEFEDIYDSISVVFSGLILQTWLLPFVFIKINGLPFMFPLKLLISFSVTLVFVAYLLRVSLFTVINTQYQLESREVSRLTPYGKVRIEYEHIRFVRSFYLPFLWSIVVVRGPGALMIIPTLTDNFDKLIRLLEIRINEAGNGNAWKIGSIKGLVRRGQANQAVFHALTKYEYYFVYALWLIPFVNLLVARYFWFLSMQHIFLWALCGVVFPVLSAILFASFILFRVYFTKKRDTAEFHTTGRIVVLCSIVLYLIGGILFRAAVH